MRVSSCLGRVSGSKSVFSRLVLLVLPIPSITIQSLFFLLAFSFSVPFLSCRNESSDPSPLRGYPQNPRGRVTRQPPSAARDDMFPPPEAPNPRLLAHPV